MAQMTVRDLDDAVYKRLKARAKANHRSLEAEVRMILAEVADRDAKREANRELAAWSEAFLAKQRIDKDWDSVAEIRAERDRYLL